MTFIKFLKNKLNNVKKKYVSYKERKRYGFTTEDIWGLDYTLAKFILPRLIAFKEMQKGQSVGNLTFEKWEQKIDDMIFAMDYVANKNCSYLEKKKDRQRLNRGFKAFSDYFMDLWY